MVQQIEFESPLSDADRNKLITDLQIEHSSLRLEVNAEGSYSVQAFDLKRPWVESTEANFHTGDEVAIHIQWNTEKYVVRGFVEKISGQRAELHSDYKVYIVQRRDNFRVNILGPTHAMFEVKTHNHSIINWQASFINLSLGGGLIEVDGIDERVHVADTLEGELKADGFREIPLKAVVRRVQSSTVFGIEFQGLSGVYLGLLNQILMRVSREATKARGSSN
jgi:c-di-GMP-binding flagellar brake protein YcgR